jgi:hypothetical protein
VVPLWEFKAGTSGIRRRNVKMNRDYKLEEGWGKVNVKVKVKLSLCLTKHQAMKTY